MKGWNEGTVVETTALLRQAIRQDPDLAFAHAYLALVLAIGHLMGLLSENEDQAEARGAAERALEIDSQDSDVLGYAGCALADLGDLARGIGLMERATELDPSNAQARAALGAALLEAGHPEGIDHLRLGMRLSPRDNRLAVWGALLARGLLRLDRTGEAIDAARAACRYDDKILLPRIVLAIACAESGAIDDAATAMSDARRLRPGLARRDLVWMATPGNLETLRSARLL
jgi:adenylate cyclase